MAAPRSSSDALLSLLLLLSSPLLPLLSLSLLPLVLPLLPLPLVLLPLVLLLLLLRFARPSTSWLVPSRLCGKVMGQCHTKITKLHHILKWEV